MEMKRSFCLIICCSLLASVLFVTYGTVPRNLLGVQEYGNGVSKGRVPRSSSSTAPSKAGDNSPPTGTVYRNRAGVNCRRSLANRACVPPVNINEACSLYNRSGCN
ncbi:hypothetical protein V6N12_041585 [Hibiscus sabdariffa]|uniref:Uncharacterized protein n=1 Tax=Hibiscus sabdariffa TaxID=183260 RepID=A0ABR2AQL6_9ROSI